MKKKTGPKRKTCRQSLGDVAFRSKLYWDGYLMTVQANGRWLGTAIFLRLLVSLVLFGLANNLAPIQATVFYCKSCFQPESKEEIVDHCHDCPARRADAEEFVFVMTVWRPFYLHVHPGSNKHGKEL